MGVVQLERAKVKKSGDKGTPLSFTNLFVALEEQERKYFNIRSSYAQNNAATC